MGACGIGAWVRASRRLLLQSTRVPEQRLCSGTACATAGACSHMQLYSKATQIKIAIAKNNSNTLISDSIKMEIYSRGTQRTIAISHTNSNIPENAVPGTHKCGLRRTAQASIAWPCRTAAWTMSLSRGIGPRDNLGSQGPLLPGYGCATPPVRQCRAPGAHRCGIAAHRAGTAVGAFIAGAGACPRRGSAPPREAC